MVPTEPNECGLKRNAEVGLVIQPALAEAAGDVILRQLVAGIGEDALGGADLDQVAEMEIGRALGYARGLLHGVGHDADGVLGAQLEDEVGGWPST